MGTFITFEGIEGCGKSTQVMLLKDFLASCREECIVFREPGGTEIGDRIREILLNPLHQNMSRITELFLYLASRSQLIEETIKRYLQEEIIIICDRFIDSTTAYQGFGRGMDQQLIADLNVLATSGIRPDLTILLDLDAKQSLSRAKKRNRDDSLGGVEDRFEQEQLIFHEKVRKGFLDIARNEQERIKIVDASGSIESIHETIVNILCRHTGKKFSAGME